MKTKLLRNTTSLALVNLLENLNPKYNSFVDLLSTQQRYIALQLWDPISFCEHLKSCLLRGNRYLLNAKGLTSSFLICTEYSRFYRSYLIPTMNVSSNLTSNYYGKIETSFSYLKDFPIISNIATLYRCGYQNHLLLKSLFCLLNINAIKIEPGMLIFTVPNEPQTLPKVKEKCYVKNKEISIQKYNSFRSL